MYACGMIRHVLILLMLAAPAYGQDVTRAALLRTASAMSAQLTDLSERRYSALLRAQDLHVAGRTHEASIVKAEADALAPQIDRLRDGLDEITRALPNVRR